MSNNKLAVRTLVAVTITVICWASAFPAIREGLKAFSPVHVAVLRYIVASIVLAGYALAIRMPLLQWRDLPGVALSGVIGITLYNVLLNTGETTVPAAVASFLIASSPIFVSLLAVVLLKEQPRRWAWIGTGISFAGVGVIASRGGLRFDANALIVLAAAICQALYFVIQKPYLKRYSAWQFTAYAIWCGTLALLLFAPGLATEIQAAPAPSVLAVVYMGIFPGALAYVTWAYGLSTLPASRAASFLYLVPAFAIVIAWLWLGEVPSVLAIAGGLLVLAGVLIVNTWGKPSPTSVEPVLKATIST